MLWYGLALNFVWIVKTRKCKTPSTTIVDDEQKMIIQYSLFMLIIQMTVTRIHHYHTIWLRVFYVWCSCSRSPFNFHIEFFFTWILILCHSHSLFGKQRRLVCLVPRGVCVFVYVWARFLFRYITFVTMKFINKRQSIQHYHASTCSHYDQLRTMLWFVFYLTLYKMSSKQQTTTTKNRQAQKQTYGWII